MAVLGQKLTHAMFYREVGRPLTTGHLFLSQHYQIQASDHTLTKYFCRLLPEETTGAQTNIKNHGQRFAYKYGLKEPEDFFPYAAQFGRGVIMWGIVLSPDMNIGNLRDYLRSKPWQRAGCRDRVLA
jgi:hypothetical protein